MKKKVSYSSTGLVYGTFWGGGEGAYGARELQADTKKDLIKQANDGLDGSLDSGMGFERLIGALLNVEKTTTIVVDGKLFHAADCDIAFIGKLTRKQKEFLLECNDM